MSLENKYYFTKSDSILSIKYKSTQEFQYIAENSQTFVTYLANIGGLISLWFGLAFVDIETMIKFIARRIRLFLIHKFRLDKIIEIIRSLVMRQLLIKLIHWFHFLEEYNWRKILSIICFPIFIHQVSQLIQSYLQFSTEVNINLISYRDSNDMIKLDALPAITVCVEQIFERLVSDEKTASLFVKLDNQLIYHPLYDNKSYEVPYIVYEVNKSIEDKLYHTLNKAIISTNVEWISYFKRMYQYDPGGWDLIYEINDYFDLKRLYIFNEEESDRQLSVKYWRTKSESQNHMFIDGFCQLDLAMKHTLDSQMQYCNKLFKIPYIISPFGKCVTFFYNNQTDNDFYQNHRFRMNYLASLRMIDEKKLYVDDYIIDDRSMKAIHQKFIVHQATTFPILSDYDMSFTQNNLFARNSFAIQLNKIQFERLEPPYDTDCIDHSNQTIFDCLNKCYRDKYLNQFKCIPVDGGIFTFDVDHLNQDAFCTKNTSRLLNILNILSQKLKSECSKYCGTPCSEICYSNNYREIQMQYLTHFDFYLSSSYYLNVKYWPKKLFYSLIIDLANTWSLWYGISLVQIIKILFSSYIKKLVVLIITKFNQPQLYRKSKVSKF